MTLSIKHAKIIGGAVADDADPNTVSPSDWDSEHVLVFPVAQCRLVWVSTTGIRLDPCCGDLLLINGTIRRVPSAGVALTNAGLTASTVYNIYAYWTGTAIALEASTTAFVLDAASGMMVKSADATRVLVGKILANASSQYTDSATSRGVLSYYNRRPKYATTAASSAVGTTTAAAWVSFAILAWSDQPFIKAEAVGSITSGAALTATMYWNFNAVSSQAVQIYTQDASGGSRAASAMGLFAPAAENTALTLVLYVYANAATAVTYAFTVSVEIWG